MKIPGNTTGSFAPRADFLEKDPKSPAFIKNNPSEDIDQAKADIKELKEDVKKKAPGQHAHNASDINEGVLSTARMPVLPFEKGGHGGANRKEGFKNLAYLGDNPVTVATDTPSSWVAFGSGFAGISIVCTVNQPDTHGSILNLVVSDYNVQQIFICLNGELLYRGGNPEYGWFHWRSVLTKDGGVFTGPVTMNGIHLTKGVDYGKEFPPDAAEGRLYFLEEVMEDV